MRPPAQEKIHYGTDGIYADMGLLPLLHALTIYSLDKDGPLQNNILNTLSAVYNDKVIKKKQKKNCMQPEVNVASFIVITTIEKCQVCADSTKS